MMKRRHGRLWRRGQVASGAVLLGVPALILATALWNGDSRAASPSSDPATMWLAGNGRLVQANALVGTPPAQIVDTVPIPGTPVGGHLLAGPGSVVMVGDDGALTRVDIRSRRAVTVSAPAGGAVAGDGQRLYRVREDQVVVLDPQNLSETSSYRLDSVVSWATAPGALYVSSTGGGVKRVDGRGVSTVRDGEGRPPLLAGVSDGVAGYDQDRGEIFVIHGDRRTTAGQVSDVQAKKFTATPDGRSFALVTDKDLTVVANHRRFSRSLPSSAGDDVVLDGDVVYLPDRAGGQVRRFRVGEGLPEEDPLRFGTPGRLRVDTHRNRQFLWFDDVLGRFAWAIHDGRPRRIEKYAAVRARPTAPPSTTPPPVPSTAPPSSPPPPARTHQTVPPTSPEPARSTRSAQPSRSPVRSARPSASPSKSGKPSGSPTPSEDPLARCDGEQATLSVADRESTGDRPRIRVTVCAKPSDGDEYWIVSNSGGQWFAKREVHGTGSYTVSLLHGSGEPGQHRDFSVVAARTAGARDWLHRNLAADEGGDDTFARDDLHSGVEIISDSVSSTS